MNILPLFYYPTKWVWVDDDQQLLKTMITVFGENTIQPFQSSRLCLDYLKNYKPPLLEKRFLKSNTTDEEYGILQHTPVDFDITMIAELSKKQDRHEEISVIVIDYSMPELDGFGLAEAINFLPIQKILLTGKAEEKEAIDAFNSNLINRFIQKGQADMPNKLSTYFKDLSIDYFKKITSPLLSHLEAEATIPLSDPIFIDFFNKYCEKNEIREYYMIDKQGSLLCIDLYGNKSCLIMQSDRGIQSWLDLYGNEKYLTEDLLFKIKNKEKIPFFGVGKEAWQINQDTWPEYFYTPFLLEGRERYFFATMKL